MSSPDDVILDVAGGRKCEVGFELKIKRSWQVKSEVVCIDPRGQVPETKRPKWKTKILKKSKEENSAELKHLEDLFNRDLLDKLIRDEGKQVRLSWACIRTKPRSPLWIWPWRETSPS